jgi:5-formyltetrahydrofolate cyclo-ligase
MEDIREQKRLIRRKMAEMKKAVSFENKLCKSQRIFKAIEEKTWFKKAETIMAYWSLPDEVQTKDFILKWHQKKNILLPVVKGDELEVRTFRGEESMIPGSSFGIMEPVGDIFTDLALIDLVIVPGVAFDRNRNRLGRGKAYYDTFLLRAPQSFKAGVCFDFQLLTQIPVEEHDLMLDEVVFA